MFIIVQELSSQFNTESIVELPIAPCIVYIPLALFFLLLKLFWGESLKENSICCYFQFILIH